MLLNMYLKEMKDMLRDRRTLLLSIALPILLLTGLTLFYEKLMSDDQEKASTLAVSHNIKDEVHSLLSQNPNIEVKAFSNPAEAVQEGQALAVLQTSENIMDKLKNGEQVNITIAGDTMSQDASALMYQVESMFTELEESIVAERLQQEHVDQNIVNPFQIEVTEINKNEDSATSLGILSIFLPMVITMSISIGASLVSIDLFAGEKERKTMEALLMTPISRLHVLISKWLTISTIGAFTGILAIIVTVLETLFLTENLKKALHFGDQLWIIILVAAIITIFFSLFTGALLMLPSIVSKTVKEAQNYSTPLTMVAILPMMFVQGMGINELTTNHFLIPFLNLYAIFKELIYGVIDYKHIVLTAASMLISVIILFIVARTLFLKDKWVMN